MRCPNCHRDTYSAKWKTCTAEGCVLSRDPLAVVTKSTTVTKVAKVGRPAKHASAADRQRAYRERKKRGEVS